MSLSAAEKASILDLSHSGGKKKKTVHLCCLTQIVILGYFIWKESKPSYLTLI